MKRIKIEGQIPLDSVGGDHYLFDHDSVKSNPVTVAHNVRVENGKLTFEVDLTPELERIIEGQRQAMFKLLQEATESEERESAELAKSSYQRALELAAENPPTELDGQSLDIPYIPTGHVFPNALARFRQCKNEKGEYYWHCMTKERK